MRVYFRRAFSTVRPEPQHAEKLTSLGTRRIFNEEHDALREVARNFFQTRVVPFHSKWEEEGQIPRQTWKEAGERGLLCMTMPGEYGGLGQDILSAAIGWEEQSYTLCTGPGFSLHSEIVAPYILKYGSNEQKMKYLPNMATGECIGAIAMTEPNAGSDLQSMRTAALPKPGSTDLVLNGSKTFITNGAMADLVIVCAKTDPNAKGSKGISLVLVENNMKGFSRGKKLNKIGLKAQDTSELFFDDVIIPKENILGPLNGGFKLLMQELPQERLLIADMSVAAAEAAFEVTREYLHTRQAFGAPLIKMQLLRHKLAKLKTEIIVSRAFMDSALLLHKEDRCDTVTASMAKMHCTDMQNRVADECVQLFGGHGFIWDSVVARHFCDARVQRIYGGTNEIMMELIARSCEISK